MVLRDSLPSYIFLDWSQRGCRTIYISAGETQCRCSHLTNFAILFNVPPPLGIHGTILSILTYVGLGISIVTTFITLLTYAIFPWVWQCLQQFWPRDVLLCLSFPPLIHLFVLCNNFYLPLCNHPCIQPFIYLYSHLYINLYHSHIFFIRTSNHPFMPSNQPVASTFMKLIHFIHAN